MFFLSYCRNCGCWQYLISKGDLQVLLWFAVQRSILCKDFSLFLHSSFFSTQHWACVPLAMTAIPCCLREMSVNWFVDRNLSSGAHLLHQPIWIQLIPAALPAWLASGLHRSPSQKMLDKSSQCFWTIESTWWMYWCAIYAYTTSGRYCYQM